MSSYKIIINPYFDAFYCSYYIQGLIDKYSKRRLNFSCKYFPKLKDVNSLAFIHINSGSKVFIDASDFSTIYDKAYSWSDKYCKINYDNSINKINYDKIIPIGPSFAINIWNFWEAFKYSFYNSFKIKTKFNMKNYIANYYRQYRYRLPVNYYSYEPSKGDMVFFLSSLWKREALANEYRASFIRACRSITSIQFIGGFAPRSRNDIQGYEDLTIAQRYEYPKYFKHIKRSAIVFNTPAVEGCHGWKLGEYLALGKAIISTPLSRALPSPLEHGIHLHFVDGSNENMKESILKIIKDKDYRRKLEKNARQYYLDFLEPKKCIDRIIS